MKLLLFLLLLAALWALWRIGSPRGKAPPRPSASTEVETMVACAHCGVHLPRSEAIAADGRHFCSTAHREQGRSPQ